MPWIYDDAQIDGIIDSNLKDSPPNAPGVNSAGVVRAMLKAFWRGMRGQVSQAVTSIDAVQNSLVARSLNLNATCYIRGDTGDDTRTGEVEGSGPTGAVKTLERAIQLHSGKTQNLTIRIMSGLVELTSDLSLRAVDLCIVIGAGSTFRSRNRVNVLDNNGVNVGGGSFRLLCFCSQLTIQNNGYLEIFDHAPYTGNGNVFYYNIAQGAISICANEDSINGVAFQTISLANASNIYLGNNCTLFASGTKGTNGYGSPLARYRRSQFSGSFTLGTNAVESVLETDKLRETLVFEGNGSAKTFNIRRTYAFQFEIVYNDGCTISAQPAANCAANANNTLTFTGAVGKTVTVRLTSNLTL